MTYFSYLFHLVSFHSSFEVLRLWKLTFRDSKKLWNAVHLGPLGMRQLRVFPTKKQRHGMLVLPLVLYVAKASLIVVRFLIPATCLHYRCTLVSICMSGFGVQNVLHRHHTDCFYPKSQVPARKSASKKASFYMIH